MEIVKKSISKNDDLKVFISSRESKCDECKEELGKKAWITLTEELEDLLQRKRLINSLFVWQ